MACRVIRQGFTIKMAFSISGFLGRFWRPGFYALNSLAPGSELQVRGYAARKGTREKALKKKRALKLKKAAQAAQQQRNASKRTLAPDLKKTVETNLSPPPTDLDVYFAKYYKLNEFSVLEAIEFHKENLHPTVLNSEKSLLNVFIELDMTAEKVTRVLNPWKAVIVYPNVFEIGFKKRILVLCLDEYKQKALEFGADTAGGHSLIKQIKKGDFDVSTYDRIVGQMALHQEISLIKAHLKLLCPKPGDGTLTVDFLSATERIKYGVEYSCNLSRSDRVFGWVEAPIGYINMEPKKLEQNFRALIEHINRKRPKREGDFITHAYCMAPPSRERLKINFRIYEDDTSSSKADGTNTSKDEEKVSAAGA